MLYTMSVQKLSIMELHHGSLCFRGRLQDSVRGRVGGGGGGRGGGRGEGGGGRGAGHWQTGS